MMKDVFQHDEVREVLEGGFFRSPAKANPEESHPTPTGRRKSRRRPKADHYDVICISMYKEDLARLDALVGSLKASGHRKMSRSGLIRFALDNVDVSQLPKAY